jgi:nitrile hydratase accessory protein
MRTPPNLPDMPSIPQDDDGPVFKAPWEAKAFGLTLSLHESGCFTWPEWVDCLSAEIAAAGKRGDPDLGDTYYQHWLAALEAIIAKKGLASHVELTERKADWQRADHDRAFGEAPALHSHTPEGEAPA